MKDRLMLKLCVWFLGTSIAEKKIARGIKYECNKFVINNRCGACNSVPNYMYVNGVWKKYKCYWC